MTDRKQNPAPIPEWMRDAIAAEPKGFMADIIAYRPGQSQSLIPDRQRSEEKPRAVNGGTAPIQPVPGVRHMDAIAESFARADRAAAARVRIDNELAEALLSSKTANRVKSEYDPAQKFDAEMPSFHRKKKDD